MPSALCNERIEAGLGFVPWFLPNPGFSASLGRWPKFVPQIRVISLSSAVDPSVPVRDPRSNRPDSTLWLLAC